MFLTSPQIKEEFINEFGEQLYSITDKLVFSYKDYEITVPKDLFFTIHKTYPEILFDYMKNERSFTNFEAKIIYMNALKCDKVPFFERVKSIL